MTEELFREDSYLKSCIANVLTVNDQGVELDRTVFYATGGGQLGDIGVLKKADGIEIQITGTEKDPKTGQHYHQTNGKMCDLNIGEVVTVELDWERRHRLMRMHTACHLLCATIEGGVTGGFVGPDKSRLDFDLENTTLDKASISEMLNRLIDEDHELKILWITDKEMTINQDLVRTMSVKPPTGSGRVRIMKIGKDIDLQPCGGTHV